ncbi:MAG: response regulator [Desulfobacteraceae bacterium]|nr:response regulator [Desulfobacteraceae bacterium]
MRSRIPPIKSHPTADKPLGDHRILVVDDEPAILFAYRKLIEKDGMSVDISATFEDTIRLIRARRYLAVIADLRLAGTDNGDGLEIIRFIQQEYPETNTILATGYSDGKIEKKALELGASYCFKKPVPPSDILGALREFHARAVYPSVAFPS